MRSDLRPRKIDAIEEVFLTTSNLYSPANLCISALFAGLAAACGVNLEDASARPDEPEHYQTTASFINSDSGKPEDTLDAGNIAIPAFDGGTGTPQPPGMNDAGSPNMPIPSTPPKPNGGVTCNDVIAPTSAAVQVVLQRSCGLARSCHAGDSPQAGLDLSTLDGIFHTAVEHPSTQAAGLSRIASGKPEESYLLRKIRNLQSTGTAMPPPPSTPLCEAKVRAIEAWIKAGAQR